MRLRRLLGMTKTSHNAGSRVAEKARVDLFESRIQRPLSHDA